MSLDLSCQNLSSVPYIDPKLSIHTLILAGNKISKITNIPETVLILDLSENDIEKIEGIPSSVISLDLYGNKITKIENIPSSINILDVSNNMIKKVENISDEIEKLYIYENDIKVLPMSMLRMCKLKEINYWDNPIEQVNTKLLNKFNKLYRHNIKKIVNNSI
jgi:hypothetical protein